MDKLRFLHFVPKGGNPKKNRPVTLCVLSNHPTNPDGEVRVSVAFARCGKDDQFCRKSGRELAQRRLTSSTPVAEKYLLYFTLPQNASLRRSLYTIAQRLSKNPTHYHQRRHVQNS